MSHQGPQIGSLLLFILCFLISYCLFVGEVRDLTIDAFASCFLSPFTGHQTLALVSRACRVRTYDQLAPDGPLTV